MKVHKILNSLVIFSLVFIIVGLFTFAHVCGAMGEVKPNCVTTKELTLVVSVVLGGLSAIQIYINNRAASVVLSVLQFICGVVILLLPIAIAPVCKMESMHCYVYTRPFLVIMGIFIIGIIIIDLLITWRKSRGKMDGSFS